MTLSVRNMIAILVTMTILLGVFFAVSLYYPTRKQARRIERSRTLLEAQVEATPPARSDIDPDSLILEAIRMDVNFFKKRHLSPTEGIPDLLEQINRMGNQMNIRFVAIKPLEEEDKPEYRRYPFLIETRAGYSELVNFVDRIENGMHLSLQDLLIETDDKDPSMHRLQFALNILETKHDLETEKERPGTEGVSPAPGPMSLVAVNRDPFSLTKRAEVGRLPKAPEAPEAVTTEKRISTKPKLVLMGIMDVAGSRVVIINNKVFRKGDVIDRQRIEAVQDDHVIMREGDKTYRLYLKGMSPRSTREVKK